MVKNIIEYLEINQTLELKDPLGVDMPLRE